MYTWNYISRIVHDCVCSLYIDISYLDVTIYIRDIWDTVGWMCPLVFLCQCGWDCQSLAAHKAHYGCRPHDVVNPLAKLLALQCLRFVWKLPRPLSWSGGIWCPENSPVAAWRRSVSIDRSITSALFIGNKEVIYDAQDAHWCMMAYKHNGFSNRKYRCI